MLKAIILDFDGTISDSFDQTVESYNSAAKTFGAKQVTQEDYKIVRNKSLRDLITHFQISKWKLPFLAVFTRLAFRKRVDELKAFLGMDELLEILSQDYKLYIASSNSKRNLEKFFRQNPSIKLSISKVYGDINPFNKHNLILKVLSENNLTKEDVIYIGDEIRDVEECKKVGVNILAVTWGFSSREILHEMLGADKCADNPTMLWKMIKKLNNL